MTILHSAVKSCPLFLKVKPHRILSAVTSQTVCTFFFSKRFIKIYRQRTMVLIYLRKSFFKNDNPPCMTFEDSQKIT